MVTLWLTIVTIMFRQQLGRLLRRVLLPHHRANHIVMLKVQLAVGGDEAPQLSEHCRTMARMLQEGIIAPRLTHKGFEQPEVRPASEALTPAVRYSSLIMRNATRSPGLVHARVEVDAYRTDNETEAALQRWELMTLNEELRGVPTREYPHRPGVFQYGTADECPKPGVAGVALVPMPRFLLESSQADSLEWEETLWRYTSVYMCVRTYTHTFVVHSMHPTYICIYM